MGSVKAVEIPEISHFMAEFWEVVKEFWKPEKMESYWEDICRKVNRLIKKYPHEFSKAMCVAFLDYLEDEYKRLEVNPNV